MDRRRFCSVAMVTYLRWRIVVVTVGLLWLDNQRYNNSFNSQVFAWIVNPVNGRKKLASSSCQWTACDAHESSGSRRCKKAKVCMRQGTIAGRPLFYMSSSSDDGDKSGLNDSDKTLSPTNDVQQRQQQQIHKPVLERLAVGGVSVSPNGFHVILKGSSVKSAASKKVDDEQNLEERFLPLKVTNDPQDHRAATSAEALTLCQLLSGVDMAGAILPPDILSKIVVYHIEEKLQDMQDDKSNDEDVSIVDGGSSKLASSSSSSSLSSPASSSSSSSASQPPIESSSMLQPQESKIVDAVQRALPEGQTTFKDAHEWFQSRTQLPQVTLDQLTLRYNVGGEGSDGDKLCPWTCRLECNLPEMNNLQLVIDDLKSETLSPLLFHYDPETSLIFTCIALALRYKAPIVLERRWQRQDGDADRDGDWDDSSADSVDDSVWSTSKDLDRSFPQRTTVAKLQQQSTRVAENIERGFEIHKLTGALQIAMRLGDVKAAERIRAKLDEYDTMQDLPTTTSAGGAEDTDDDSLYDDNEDDKDGDTLDDLEKNLFQ